MDDDAPKGSSIVLKLQQLPVVGKGIRFALQNKASILLWAALFILVLFVYHFLSDGDFSFLLTLGGIFRLFAFSILIYKIHSQKSAASISFKTLQCYVIVFFFRLCSILIYDGYLPYDRSGDWFYQLIELLSLAMVVTACYMVFFAYGDTYDMSDDRFGANGLPTELGTVFLVAPALILAIIMHPGLNGFWLTDVAWTFALYLEAVAILPQLYMFHKNSKGAAIEAFTSHFVFALGVARLMHFIFWLSTHTELENRMSMFPGGQFVGYAVLLSQLVHLLLMVDFSYYYILSLKHGGPLVLPTTV